MAVTVQRMTMRGTFIPDRELALFLDVDGTLLEIATTPDAVKVPASLRNTLSLAAEREQGALALISGRSLQSLDTLFAPCRFPAAGLHGIERRRHDGTLWRADLNHDALAQARAALMRLAADMPGTLLEDKAHAIALHYRQVPHLDSMIRTEIHKLAQQVTPHLQVKPGKFVWEFLPAGHSKRTAIEAFMQEAPFRGRVPVFVGDDVTDEDGFAAVNEMGGYSVHVGSLGATQAHYRFGSVSAVIGWLRERNVAMPRAR